MPSLSDNHMDGISSVVKGGNNEQASFHLMMIVGRISKYVEILRPVNAPEYLGVMT